MSRALSAAYLLAKRGRQPLDIWRVTQPERAGWAFQSFEWAMASDLDLGSDKWRWMGKLRFDLYALLRMATLWRYQGTLRFRRVGGTDEWETLDGQFLLLWANNMKWNSHDVQLGPRAAFDDGAADIVVIQRASRCGMLSEFIDLSKGQVAELPWVEYLKVSAFELEPLPRTPREPGMIAVDGEEWPLAKTLVEVLPQRLTLLGGPVPDTQPYA